MHTTSGRNLNRCTRGWRPRLCYKKFQLIVSSAGISSLKVQSFIIWRAANIVTFLTTSKRITYTIYPGCKPSTDATITSTYATWYKSKKKTGAYHVAVKSQQVFQRLKVETLLKKILIHKWFKCTVQIYCCKRKITVFEE